MATISSITLSPRPQKVILGAFGLDEEWMKTQARLIGKDIQNAAMPEEQKDDDEDAENEEY